ncbi:glutamate-cysteine ligase family protein [Wenyingzhuangia aestuarii]|uniref:glutamate-cysteine ligase family protein n=1 Tax=Wenyingzhuangia aestuarii TaxID=1647582 RepID=UPI00143A6E72|nr:glutamate-cysteine ligase family protein [Wenyingzhuangia aestuarii]NJB82389.1 carboxylate-amine ligase [Wenyingzhuangia aestuarii]
MKTKYKLFEVYGIELEYMLVHNSTFKVQPKVANLLTAKNGTLIDDIDNGTIGWSNELVAHVVEIKTQNPVNNLTGLDVHFHQNIIEINNLLAQTNSKLLGTACHPLMNPFTETKLWEHGSNEIYELYNTIFDCKGHGWSNLQSMHINLPFANNEEFEKLHAAIRILLPILPGLCASSPILDGKLTGYKDSRLESYKYNQKEIPIIAGSVIPEQVFSRNDYETIIFEPIKKAIEPFDKEKVLDHYFVNSRGAIARFDRNAIEIRVMDIQECPKADISIAILVTEVLKTLVYHPFTSLTSQKNWNETALAVILNNTIKQGENYRVTNVDYAKELGVLTTENVQTIWKHLYQTVVANIPETYKLTIEFILEKGTLSTRIEKALENNFSEKNIQKVYTKLADCLQQNILFDT